MNEAEEIVLALNRLLQANCDRENWYVKAAFSAKTFSGDLSNFFHHMAAESRRHARAIVQDILMLQGEPVEVMTNHARWNMLWFDIKTLILGMNSDSLLYSSERTEENTLDIYRKVRQKPFRLNRQLNQKVDLQYQTLFHSLQLICNYQHRYKVG